MNSEQKGQYGELQQYIQHDQLDHYDHRYQRNHHDLALLVWSA